MRKILLSLALIILVVVPAYADQIHQPQVSQDLPLIQKNYVCNNKLGIDLLCDLIAYFHFQELAWDGTSGEVRDSSGNNNHGTATNASTVAAGKLGRGGTFNQ